MHSMIDVGIVILFLGFNLIVGLWHKSRSKDIRDYAVGGKNFSTGVLTATIAATWISGSSFFVDLENTYISGLGYMLPFLGAPLCLLITGYIAQHMGKLLNHLSVAEAIGSVYGKTARTITAVSAIAGDIGYIALQFGVMGKILSIILGINSTWGAFCAASVVIVYSSVGGIKSVTFTDVIQFFTFGTIIPLIALSVWDRLGDTHLVAHTLATHPNFSLKHVCTSGTGIMGMLSLFFYAIMPPLGNPAMFQRMAMAKSPRQVRNAFGYSALICLLVQLLISWIGILLLADNAALNKSEIMPHLLHTHIGTVMKGLLASGILAMAMSTADSCLNAITVLFANDIIAPIMEQKERPLRIAKIFSWIVGFAALFVSINVPDLLSIILLSGSVSMPIITMPLVIAILGFRTSPRVAVMAMTAGFITVILWSLCYDNESSIFPGMLANCLGLFGSHYLLREEGG